jgi:hypothetical protein
VVQDTAVVAEEEVATVVEAAAEMALVGVGEVVLAVDQEQCVLYGPD